MVLQTKHDNRAQTADGIQMFTPIELSEARRVSALTAKRAVRLNLNVGPSAAVTAGDGLAAYTGSRGGTSSSITPVRSARRQLNRQSEGRGTATHVCCQLDLPRTCPMILKTSVPGDGASGRKQAWNEDTTLWGDY